MSVLKKRFVYVGILVTVLITLLLIGVNKLWVENYYSDFIYPPFARTLRNISGRIPFSIGDVIYALVGIWLLYKLLQNFIAVFRKKTTLAGVGKKVAKIFYILLFFYIILILFWGLNYSRKGIGYQLGLGEGKYDSSQLLELQNILVQKVNQSKSEVKETIYPDKKQMFNEAIEAYKNTSKQFPFLKYNIPSVKSSLFGELGNYIGFTGYYNPFTGEAQVNTTVPPFLVPSITVHEIAHQIGYAKEDEANFVGFLVGTNSGNPLFEYSSYLDLLVYVNSGVRFFDSTRARLALRELSGPVQMDILEWKKFNLDHESFLQPVFKWVYGNFLKMNEQPQGILSYDMVTSLAVSYYEKKGLIR